MDVFGKTHLSSFKFPYIFMYPVCAVTLQNKPDFFSKIAKVDSNVAFVEEHFWLQNDIFCLLNDSDMIIVA